MNSLCIKKIKQYVGKMTRSDSPVYYRIYKHTKGFYITCWCCWNYEDRPTQMNWFRIFFAKREIAKVLNILNQPNCELVDTDFLPMDFAGFNSIQAISLRKQEGILPTGKPYSSWCVLTKIVDECGDFYSFPYSNCFKRQDAAFRCASEMLKYVQLVNPKVEVILESPIDGNNFWRNQTQVRAIAYEQQAKQAEGERTSSVSSPQSILETPS